LINNKIYSAYYNDSDYYFKKAGSTNSLIKYKITNNNRQAVFYVECSLTFGAINNMSFYWKEENGIKLFEVKKKSNDYIIIDKEDIVGTFQIAKKNICFYCDKGQKQYFFVPREEVLNKVDSAIDILFSLIGDSYNSFYSAPSSSCIFDIHEEKSKKRIGTYFPKINNLEWTFNSESELDRRGALAAVIILKCS